MTLPSCGSNLLPEAEGSAKEEGHWSWATNAHLLCLKWGTAPASQAGG